MAAPKELTLDQRIEAKRNMQTDWDTPKDTWEYVTIPKENTLGETHASVGINGRTFTAGNTYLVPKKIADEMRDRLAVYQKSVIRILQPRRDAQAESAVARSNPLYATPVDPTTLKD